MIFYCKYFVITILTGHAHDTNWLTSLSSVSHSVQGPPPLPVAEDGSLQPGVEVCHPGVHPRHTCPPTPDAEADNPQLVPLARLLADQGPPAVPVTRVTPLRPGTDGAGGETVAGPELVLQGRVTHRLLPQWHRDLLEDHTVVAAWTRGLGQWNTVRAVWQLTLSSPPPAGDVAVWKTRLLDLLLTGHTHHVNVLLPLGRPLQLQQSDVIDQRGVVEVWMNLNVWNVELLKWKILLDCHEEMRDCGVTWCGRGSAVVVTSYSPILTFRMSPMFVTKGRLKIFLWQQRFSLFSCWAFLTNHQHNVPLWESTTHLSELSHKRTNLEVFLGLRPTTIRSTGWRWGVRRSLHATATLRTPPPPPCPSPAPSCRTGPCWGWAGCRQARRCLARSSRRRGLSGRSRCEECRPCNDSRAGVWGVRCEVWGVRCTDPSMQVQYSIQSQLKWEWWRPFSVPPDPVNTHHWDTSGAFRLETLKLDDLCVNDGHKNQISWQDIKHTPLSVYKEIMVNFQQCFLFSNLHGAICTA